jgi:hypothetical protein
LEIEKLIKVPHQMNEHLDWYEYRFENSAALRQHLNFKQKIQFHFSSYILVNAALYIELEHHCGKYLKLCSQCKIYNVSV